MQTPTLVPAHIRLSWIQNGHCFLKSMTCVFGHKAGMDARRTVAIAASDGVRYDSLSLLNWNWTRPDQGLSLSWICRLSFTWALCSWVAPKNMKIQMIGGDDRLLKQRLWKLWKRKREELTKLEYQTILNFALNYSGRAEITQASQSWLRRMFWMPKVIRRYYRSSIGNIFTGHLPALRDQIWSSN